MDIARLPRPALRGLTLVTVLTVGGLDLATGYELGFFAFYFAPIALAAWYDTRAGAVATALLCALAWLASDVLSGHLYSAPLFRYWNVAMRGVSFLLVGLLLHKIRALLDTERRTNAELTAALQQVRELRELLSMCAWCKRIRSEEGEWEKVEVYLKLHKSTDLSHSICPTCSLQVFGETADEDAA